MRPRPVALLITMALAAVLALLGPSVLAQDTPSTGVPTQDIIPKPNSGHEPSEAGDRGGALQLLVLGVVVVAVSGAVVHLTRASRRARSTTP
jgi:hypothetical protein